MITPEQFADYIDCFNRSDFDGFSKYYADDVLFEGRGRHFVGPQAIIDFYRIVKDRMEETLVVRNAYFGEDGFAVELETTLKSTKDWPDFFGGPMKVGDVKRSLNFIFYTVRDDKFAHIRSANFAQLT
jgi:hypothetical protein